MGIFDDWNGQEWEDTGESWTPEEQASNIETFPVEDYSNDNYQWDSGSVGGGISDWFNNGSTSGGDGGFDLSNPSYNYEAPPTSPTMNWGSMGGSIQNVLSDLFTKGTTANQIGQVGTALLSGYQNNQKAKALQGAAKQIDPWAGQRPYYQQQAQQANANPYGTPIVANQIAQLQAAQDRKDAAAGRRSNSLMGDTSVMAQAAQIAQNYQNQMAQQGGSNINPSGLSSVLTSAANASTDGYISPLANVFGYNTQNNANDTKIAALQKFLQGS